MKRILFNSCFLMLIFSLNAGMLWDGDVKAVSCRDPRKNPVVSVENGTLQIAAGFNEAKHSYLIFDVAVKPLVIKDKSLQFEFASQTVLPGDSFYIKGLDKDNQNVISFYVYLANGRPRIMTCTPGMKLGEVNWFAKDVKVPVNTPIVKFRFFCGRRAGKSEMKISLRNIKLVPRVTAAVEKAAVEKAAVEKVYTGKVVDSGIVWNGDKKTLACGNSRWKPEFTVNGKSFKLSAAYESTKNDYLIFDALVTPFTIKDRSLKLQFSSDPVVHGDTFYIKGLDVNGKNVFSFYSVISNERQRTFICTPGADMGGVRYFASDVKMPENTPVVRLRFFCGRRAGKSLFNINIGNIELIPRAGKAKVVEPKDYGLAVRGGTSRGAVAAKDGSGRDCLVIWLMDEINRRMLQIDVQSGKTDEIAVPFSNPDAVYSSILAANGKCYSLYGRHFVEYDPALKKFTFVQKVDDLAAMAMDEKDGVIWAATYPKCHLVSFDTKTRKFNAYGQIHQADFNQYPRTLIAGDDGKVYAGIGFTVGQVVCFDPATGKASALIPEKELLQGKMLYVRRFTDGKVYARHLDLFYRLENGRAIRLSTPPKADIARNFNTGSQGLVVRKFPSGRVLESFDLGSCSLVTTAADGSDRKEVKFSYANHGAPLMGIAVNDRGIVAGGGFFPFCFGVLNGENGKKEIYAGLQQCNAITSQGKYIYIASYPGGMMTRFDPDKPWSIKSVYSMRKQDLSVNPVYYGRSKHLSRPHAVAVSDDGKILVGGGTPDYGFTGGGLAIVDTVSGKFTEVDHTKLAENEAPYALAVMNDGLIVCGTTIAPGTGGRLKAKNGSLLIYDSKAGKTVWKSKELGNIYCVLQLIKLNERQVMGLTSSYDLFVLDVPSRKIICSNNISGYAPVAMNQSCRALQHDGRNSVYLLTSGGVGKIDPASCEISKYVIVKGGIQVGGGIHNGILYFISNKHYKSIDLTKSFK